MSDEIKFQFTPEASAILNSLETWPARLLTALARTMDKENQLTIAHISQVRMRGNNGKPFPPEQGILGIRTGHLYRSLRASEARVLVGAIVSGLGSNVRYAGTHEFGADIKRVQLAGSVRLRVDRQGNRIRQARNPNLFVFAKRTHKRFETVQFDGGKRFSIRIPARAPITRGIRDRVPDYSKAMSKTVETTKLT
jgi:hypothetical protein